MTLNLLAALALFTASAETAAPTSIATLRDPGDLTGIEILASEAVPDVWRTEIVVALEGLVETRHFAMEGPDRIVVDLLNARTNLDGGILPGAQGGGVLALRAAQYSPEIVRFELELTEPLDYEVTSGAGYVRISVVNPFGDFAPWSLALAPQPSAPVDLAALPADVLAVAPPTITAPALTAPALPTLAPAVAQQDFAQRITINFSSMDIRDVLSTFADIAGRSIVPSAQVTGVVSADIVDQPWDVALQTILDAQGLAATEGPSGIIRVERLEDIVDREDVEPLATRAFRLEFLDATDLEASVETLLTERGDVSVTLQANALVVTDVPRVLDGVQLLIDGLDLRRPQITISSTIVFVDRTGLDEFGVVYDLKDSRGNQLNQLTPGAIDRDNDGLISELEEVDTGTNVVALGGNSIAALGNANERVLEPSIQFMTSLLLGRHTLISFIEALQSMNLSDVVARPQITVQDNELAEILVGERTPIRVIDVAAGGAAGGGAQATVQIEETGIILNVTPHVTAGDLIRMDVRAERSGLQPIDSDLGVIFNAQEATTSMLVQDGETAVIGGLTVTERTEFTAGIPLLQDLPLLGRFFRVTREEVTQRELMILVTPQIQRD
jgi:type IV pilus assembly protein PilQ